MATPLVQPFTALRPRPEFAGAVAARPYDVVSFEEAKAQAAGRPLSFLHVSRAEIDCAAGTDPHAPEVYARAAQALATMQADGALFVEPTPCLYAYRMTAGDHVQTGLAFAASVAAYVGNRIRRHEHTRPDKEMDRMRQIAAVGAHTGPVLLAHPSEPGIDAALAQAATGAPVADAVTVDGTRHQVWRIADPQVIAALVCAFEALPAIYIADGHHRSAAAARLAAAGGDDRARVSGDARFLAVSFAAEQLRILGYHRVVVDLNGLDRSAFLARLESAFTVEALAAAQLPVRRGTFSMALADGWFRLSLKQPPPAAPARDRLDVSLLNQRLLRPILGITDERTDPRIGFVGGGRGVEELERQCTSGEAAVAFALHPTAFADVIAVADAGDVMPPKSTWFEPKLADGLLSLPLSR